MSHRATMRICSVVPPLLVTLLTAEKISLCLLQCFTATMCICSFVSLLITLLVAVFHREDESLLCCPTIDNPAHCSAYSTNQSRRPSAVSLYTVWDMYRKFFGVCHREEGSLLCFPSIDNDNNQDQKTPPTCVLIESI